MATKAMNIRMDEQMLSDIRTAASVYGMTITEVVQDAIDEHLARLRQDPFYRLTVNVAAASAEETQEILDEINALSEDDLEIASVKRIDL